MTISQVSDWILCPGFSQNNPKNEIENKTKTNSHQKSHTRFTFYTDLKQSAVVYLGALGS